MSHNLVLYWEGLEIVQLESGYLWDSLLALRLMLCDCISYSFACASSFKKINTLVRGQGQKRWGEGEGHWELFSLIIWLGVTPIKKLIITCDLAANNNLWSCYLTYFYWGIILYQDLLIWTYEFIFRKNIHVYVSQSRAHLSLQETTLINMEKVSEETILWSLYLKELTFQFKIMVNCNMLYSTGKDIN